MRSIIDEARKSTVIKVIVITAIAVLGFILIGCALREKGII
jgi:hypothetical protein